MHVSRGSVPSESILHWANVCCSAHAIVQPCVHTTSEAFHVVKELRDVYTVWNFECCAKTRFNCANSLVALRSCAPQKGQCPEGYMHPGWEHLSYAPRLGTPVLCTQAGNTCSRWHCCDRKARVTSAQSFTLWQQATIEIILLLLARATSYHSPPLNWLLRTIKFSLAFIHELECAGAVTSFPRFFRLQPFPRENFSLQ